MAKEEKDTLMDADVSSKEEKKAAKEKTKAQKNDKKSKKNEGKNSEGKKQNRVAKWFRDLKIEFKNVTWPTKNTVLVNTSIVLGTIVASSIFVGLVDAGMLKVVQMLLDLSQK